MVTPRERRHFQEIARIEAELAQESLAADAGRTPGENIELGFALAEFAASFGGELEHGEEIAPAALWRARRGARR